MKKITLFQLKQAYKNFDDFARFCFNNGTIIIDFKTEHTHDTYFIVGEFYCRVESDNDSVDRIAYYTVKPEHWNVIEQNENNLIKKSELLW